MNLKTTHFPCVKGKMGDWVYYVTVMGVSDIVKYVGFAEQVCPNSDLDLMIQREVSTRSRQIAEYLRQNEQRFFGSLIVAAYDGQPKFLPISFGGTPLLAQLEGSIGILQFDGSEQYYAVDGQHRLAALKEVIEKGGDGLVEDQISVIVICHSKDAQGMARARRLFTTVNRYAKKTSPVTNIVMDEDDGVAVITRRLIREDDFFSQRIKVVVKSSNGQPRLATGEAMQQSDASYLMAIGTFYKCNQALLPTVLRPAFSKAQQAPLYEELEAGFEQVKSRWKSLIDNVELWTNLKQPQESLQHGRSRDGGDILARPVGIASFIRSCGKAFDANIPLPDIATVAKLFRDIASAPWRGVLWNAASRRMIAGKEAENLAARLWTFYLGLPEDQAKLEEDWKARIDPQNENPNLRLPDRPHV